MRQSDFGLSQSQDRRDTLGVLAAASVTLSSFQELGGLCLLEAINADENLKLLMQRKMHIQQKSFNINQMYDLECIKKLRFLSCDTYKITEAIGVVCRCHEKKQVHL